MAIFSLQLTTINRSTRSVVAAAAYRSKNALRDARTDVLSDYTRRRGVTDTFILMADGLGGASTHAGDVRDHRETLWNAAEAAEKRRDSVTAREFRLALPHEVSAATRRLLATEFARELVARYGVAVDVALHAPSHEGDQRNHHAHLMMTTREVTPDCTFGAKTKVWDHKITGGQELTAVRLLWEQMCNTVLEGAGVADRVNSRSHVERGLEMEPGLHVGVHATAIERKARLDHERKVGADGPAYEPVTERGRQQRDIERRNAALRGAIVAVAEADAELADVARRFAEEQAAARTKAVAESTPAEIEVPDLPPTESPSPPVPQPSRGPVLVPVVEREITWRKPDASGRGVVPPQSPKTGGDGAGGGRKLDRARDDARRRQRLDKEARAREERVRFEPLPPDETHWRTVPLGALREEVARLRPAQTPDQLAAWHPRVVRPRSDARFAHERGVTAARFVDELRVEIKEHRARLELLKTWKGGIGGALSRLGFWLHTNGLIKVAEIASAEREIARLERRIEGAERVAAERFRDEAEALERAEAIEREVLPTVQAEQAPRWAHYHEALRVLAERELAAMRAAEATRREEVAKAERARADADAARAAAERARIEAEIERRRAAETGESQEADEDEDDEVDPDDGIEPS